MAIIAVKRKISHMAMVGEHDMSKAPSRTQDQFIVRLPDGMRDRIKYLADRNGRSMNAEIVSVLEQAFPPLITASETQIEVALRAARDGLYASDLSDQQKDELWEKMMAVIYDGGL